MRYAWLAALLAFIFIVTAPFLPGDELSVGNYRMVETHRVSATHSSVTYTASLINSGGSLAAVSARVASIDSSVKVAANTLTFVPIPAHSQAASSNTFTILVDRRVPFEFSKLKWTFESAPIAHAGRNRTVKTGSTVQLNASGSTNPGGAGLLTYQWALTTPPGSKAVLTDTSSVTPTFDVDVPGAYVADLAVSNGTASSTARVVINTESTPPTADAGPNQTVTAGRAVTLNGSRSTDADSHLLTYSWTLIGRPEASRALLTNANTVSPTFVADESGTYLAQLIVNDGQGDSLPSTVAISTSNTPPVASAGSDQKIVAGDLVQLDGAGSTDVDGNEISYHWSLLSKPQGSAAELSSATDVNPVFLADRPGAYVAQLIVNDGQVNSAPTTVSITTGGLPAPEANAGRNQTVAVNSAVTLQGSGRDLGSSPLSYQWALVARPEGSRASLLNPSASRPAIIPDLEGTYVAQLVVNNGVLDSVPTTVSITTAHTAPEASAGRTQTVSRGAIVQLDGSASSDGSSSPLTYSWALLSRPSGSQATLTTPHTATPTFVADVLGTYVAQLIVNDGVSNSTPVTATVKAATQAITLTPDPLNLTLFAGTMTVRLMALAAGDQIIHLYTSDPSIANIPASVTVFDGTASADFTVTPGNSGTATINALYAGTLASATVNVVIPTITLALDSNLVGVSRSVNGTITLNTPAPPAGLTVTLMTNPGGIASLPATVQISPSATTAAFSVTGVAQGSTLITASGPGYTNGFANVKVGNLGQIILPTNLVIGANQTVTYPVRLATPAPTGGVTVTLTSSDASKVTINGSVMADVNIPVGAFVPDVQPQITGLNFGDATITASASGFLGDTESVKVAASLSFSPSSVTFGTNSTQQITLNISSPAPAGLTVTLSSDNPGVATVPASVTFPANATSVPVTLTNISAGTTVIHANAPGLIEATATVTVANFGAIILPANVLVGVGQQVTFPVSIAGQAPANGVTITLMSTDTSKLTISSGTVFIAAGETTPATQPKVTGVNIGSANITASGPGLTPASQAVQVGGTLSFNPSSLSIDGPSTQNLMLNLSSGAPAGLTIALASSDVNVASVPVSVPFPTGATSVQVPVTSVGVGSATITATANQSTITTATATVTVTGTFMLGSITIPASLNVGPNQSVPFQVTLSGPAGPAGVTVTLTSNDPSVTVTPSVFIPSGQVSPASMPQVTGANFGTAKITASAPSYTSATMTVQVSGTLSFLQTSVTIAAASTQNITLNLSGPAPAGFTVNLTSSNPGVVTVPANVTFTANATSVQVPVTGVAPGTATISTSTAVSNVTQASTNITVNPALDIILPSGLTVAPGQQIPIQIKLAKPAPPNGTFVSLTSSDNSKLTISPTIVVIPEGATTPAFPAQISGVDFGTVTLTASATGLASSTTTIVVQESLSLSPQNLTFNSTGATQTLVLSLPTPSPGELTVTLTSSNPGVATVQGIVFFHQNNMAILVPVTSVAGGTTVIRASAPNSSDATATVTVLGAGTINLPSNVTVSPGQSAEFPVILGTPAPSGGVTVALTSSDSSKATLSTTSVVIPAGATIPSVQPQVMGVNFGTATISASAPGYTTASQPVQVSGALSFAPQSLTITGTTSQNITLNLSAVTPAALTIGLSSSNTGAATVPTSVMIAAGSSSATVSVTGVAPGTAVITANANTPNITNTTANVTVVSNQLGTITLPSNVKVAPGQAAQFPVTLSVPAPAGGVTVSLSSSDSSVTVTPTVFVAAGATSPSQQPQVTGVNFGTSNISASAQGYVTATQPVQVIGTLSFTPTSLPITAPQTSNLTLNVSAAAPPAGLIVNISSSNSSVASVPTTVTIPGGMTSVTVPVTGVSAGSATITAASSISTVTGATATATVTGSSVPAIGLPANVNVPTGTAVPFPVTLLGGPAPPGGVTVTLTNSDNVKIGLSTTSVFIPGGATTPAVQPQLNGYNIGTVTISASAPGYQAASVNVNGTATVRFAPTSITASAGTTPIVMLILSSAAPPGDDITGRCNHPDICGITVFLHSDNPAVASVQPSLNFLGDGSSQAIEILGISAAGPGTTLIHAGTPPYIPDTTLMVTVTNSGSAMVSVVPPDKPAAQ